MEKEVQEFFNEKESPQIKRVADYLKGKKILLTEEERLAVFCVRNNIKDDKR